MSEPYIIAEAAQGYEGVPEIARLLVKAAGAAGADAVKFQLVYVEELCERGYEHYDLFKSLEMSDSVWRELRGLADNLGMHFMFDVFGHRSLELANTLDADGIKLHSTTFFESDLVEATLASGRSVYVSVGGVRESEILDFLAHEAPGHEDQIVLLYGFQAEPTLLKDTRLARVSALRAKTGLEVGFMDHADGSGEDTVLLSAAALGFGVRVFEKHITLDRELELEDYVSALAPGEFADYVRSLRRLATAVGDASLELSDQELTYRSKAIKRVVASRDLEEGTAIDQGCVRLSRPAEPSGFFKLDDVIGRRVVREIADGKPVTQEDIV